MSYSCVTTKVALKILGYGTGLGEVLLMDLTVLDYEKA